MTDYKITVLRDEKLHFTVTRWIPAHIRWAEKETNKKR